MLAEAVKTFVSPVDICFKSMKGVQILSLEEDTRLTDLVSSQRDEIKMEIRLIDAEVLLFSLLEPARMLFLHMTCGRAL